MQYNCNYTPVKPGECINKNMHANLIIVGYLGRTDFYDNPPQYHTVFRLVIQSLHLPVLHILPEYTENVNLFPIAWYDFF